MKNIEEVKNIIKALKIHCTIIPSCKQCPYYEYSDCVEKLLYDIWEFIEQLKLRGK